MPTRAMTHVDSILTNMSIKYGNDEGNYIAHRAFPHVDVKKQSDIYSVYSKADFLRVMVQKAVPGKKAAVLDYDIDVSNKYFCQLFDGAFKLPDVKKANYDSPLEADRGAVKFLTEQFYLKREIDFMNAAFVTGVWATEHVGVASGATGTQFVQFDASSAAMIKPIRKRINTAEIANGGRRVNRLVFGEAVWRTAQDHDDFLQRVQYSGSSATPADVTEKAVAEILKVDEVLVSRAVQNTAAKSASASMSRMAGNHVLLLTVTNAPSTEEPSAGYTFGFSPFDMVKNGKVAINSYYDRARKSTFFEGEMAFDHRIVASDFGLLMLNAVSASA